MRSSAERPRTKSGKTKQAVAPSPVEEVWPDRLREWKDEVLRQADTNPARTLAVAAGAGYLLGGGLFSPLTARLVATGVKLGLRFALLPFVSQRVVALAEDLLSEASNSDSEDEDHSSDVKINNATTRQSDQKETHS